MNGQLDLITLISLIIAAVAIVKLRSVLGTKTDEDDARVERLKARDQAAADSKSSNGSGEVIALPRRDREESVAQDSGESAISAGETRIRAYPASDPATTEGLLAINKYDRNFDPEPFLHGAKRAYEMIVSAFASGDRKALKDLLSRDVFDGFTAAIAERENRGELIDQQFVGIKKADIVGAEVQNGAASVTVRFLSELITATRDKSGTVVGGDPQRITEVTDIWTFSRDVSSKRALDNPNWKLVETQPPN
jgi:predicted lipid-binding transport protein (Tim44 family)